MAMMNLATMGGGPQATPQESTQPFNWDQYTGGVTGQPTGTIDQGAVSGALTTPGVNGQPVYTGGYNPNQTAGNVGQPAAAGGQGDPEAFRAAWFASGGKTTDDLKAFVAAHPEYGATITGSKGSKLTFPGGQAFQAVRSAGLGGGIGPAWDDLGGSGGAAGGASGGGTGLSSLANGSLMTPWTQDFHAPTAEEALNSSGLQFAIQQGQQGIQNSAAAKGTLLTGGTLKDLTAYGTGAALQGYGDVYNRAVGEYGTARDNFYANQDRPFSKLYNLSSLGAGAANQTGGFGSSYGTNATGSLGDIGNANSAGSAAQGSIWGNYLSNLGKQ